MKQVVIDGKRAFDIKSTRRKCLRKAAISQLGETLMGPESGPQKTLCSMVNHA
jgi:hypothetical protein